jgi:L-rhamnose mutarotase
MTRHVLTVRLKDGPGVVESYTRHHREVWPEVQASLKHSGVEQMDIYLLGRNLVMILEMRNGVDYREALALHALSSLRVVEWEGLMKSLQEPCVGARAGEWWAVMEPVFHLNPDTVEVPAVAHVADQSRTI